MPELANEDPRIVSLMEGTGTVLLFVSNAYAHYKSLTVEHYADDTNNELAAGPFKFYKMSTQYFLTIQFCKLFEKSRGTNTSKSSLIDLDAAIFQKYPSEYASIHEENELLIASIIYDSFFERMKILRNKCYAHGDDHTINPDLKFIYFNAQEIEDFDYLLMQAIEVFKM